MEKINAEVFMAITRLGSYSKAADELGYTKAGIGYIVNSMEEAAGFRIFRREYGGVRLTPEGEALLPYIQRLRESENAVSEQADRILEAAYQQEQVEKEQKWGARSKIRVGAR